MNNWWAYGEFNVSKAKTNDNYIIDMNLKLFNVKYMRIEYGNATCGKLLIHIRAKVSGNI